MKIHSNVSLVEAIVRFVIASLFAILAVVTEMYLFMIVAMIILATGLSQYCPLKDIFKINFFNNKF